MEHSKEKIKLTEGIHFYLVPETGDFCIAEIRDSYEQTFGMSRELLRANAHRLITCWNEHDGLVAEIVSLTNQRNEACGLLASKDRDKNKTKADLFPELVEALKISEDLRYNRLPQCTAPSDECLKCKAIDKMHETIAKAKEIQNG